MRISASFSKALDPEMIDWSARSVALLFHPRTWLKNTKSTMETKIFPVLQNLSQTWGEIESKVAIISAATLHSQRKKQDRPKPLYLREQIRWVQNFLHRNRSLTFCQGPSPTVVDLHRVAWTANLAIRSSAMDSRKAVSTKPASSSDPQPVESGTDASRRGLRLGLNTSAVWDARHVGETVGSRHSPSRGP
jgi:hypothetical protein